MVVQLAYHLIQLGHRRLQIASLLREKGRPLLAFSALLFSEWIDRPDLFAALLCPLDRRQQRLAILSGNVLGPQRTRGQVALTERSKFFFEKAASVERPWV